MTQPLRAAIFDVDGVLVDSPHERAWREALADFADPAGFTPDFYQAEVAGRPRLDGARATLAALAPPASEARVAAYAAAKQARIEALIEAGAFRVFDDAARLADRLHEAGWRLALASSSRNAAAMMARLALPDGTPLASLFHADLSGIAVTRGKPDPELFLRAAAALGVPPEACLVVEDAPAGIAAARAAGMTSLAIARRQDAPLLAAADVIVDNLDRFNPPDFGWTITAEGVDPAREASVEARLSLANGFLGERAARGASRGPAWTSRLPWLRWAAAPRCVIAGVFDTQDTVPPVAAQAPAPDWSRLRLTLDGTRLRLTDGDCLAHRRTLDLRRGVLTGEWRHRLAGTEITLRVTRALSLADRALALQRVEIRLDRDGIAVGLTALLDLAGLDLDLIALEPDALSWRTPGETAALAARARLLRAGAELPPLPAPALHWRWSWTSVAGETLVLERLTAASRADLATARATRDAAPPWRPALAAHIDAWAARWQMSDVALDGDPAIARALRFALYHLNAVANPDDPAVSIGARALSGEAYLGHVFWDTEIYLLPFYIAAWPDAARALLLYRHRTLPAARAKATSIGCDGALFAWESADSGAETTPAQLLGADGRPVDILTGRQEQHISADIAYAVWQYWRATGDAAFMRAAGAELLLDIARFWFSRATLEPDGRRHIRHVIGPDEYHEDIDDNAFTNTMAAWSIARALDAVALGFAPAAPEHDAWRAALPQFATGLDPATGLYEQFAGFHALAPVDLASLPQGVPADVALGRDRVRASQVVKQADVVMLAALLPDAFPGATLAANYDHYAPRCAHGSSLSHAMHALVAARLGRADEALAHLRATADADLAETTDSGYGVHIAGLGGLWQAVLLGFAGLDLMAETLTLAPRLPAHWTRLEFPLHWQGRRLTCRLGATPALTLLDGPALDARVGGIEVHLEPGVETLI